MDIREKYKQERDRLELNRSLDWASEGIQYKVAGTELKPMTVQTWFDLMVVKSPIVTHQEISIESVVDYLWRNCKKFTKNPFLKEWRLFWIQNRVMKALKKNESTQELVEVLCAHVKASFDEIPESMSATNDNVKSMQAVSGECAMLDEIAHRYGMSPLTVLKMPLRQAFSLQRTIRVATIPEYKLLEPPSLRTIKSEYLNQINNG